ncbi:MAG: RNA 2',3'-cyclic phosphodiesterase [Candidatus Bathyarchaeota archaeon]|nr:MAG: RNA 2',3'-cyclic phosphodiesterase [Candidatus Bathyarchaeota archaeon]
MLERIRSFIAFDINCKSLLGKLAEVQSKLANTGANLKLVKPQNIHITIRFLGDIHPNMVDAVHKEMEKASFAPFDVELKGVGVFPNAKYLRIVWAGIHKGSRELGNLFDQLEPRLLKLGFKPEAKGFSPHLTIARVRTARNKRELIRYVEELGDHEFGVLKADCLRLKKSVLTPKGPIYSTLKEVCH